MDYIVKSVPINEDQVYKSIFPRFGVEDDPKDLIQPQLILIDTKFRHIAYFQKMADLLRSKGFVCGLVTDLPFDLVERDLDVLEQFDFCVFFDWYILQVYPFAKTAARRALDMVSQSTMAFMPRIASLGYLEMTVSEEKIPHAYLALTTGKVSFTFCELLSSPSKELNQFKSLVSCPKFLEIKLQEAAHYPVVLDDNSDNIKVTTIYWLNQEQLLEQTDSYRAFHEKRKLFFLTHDLPNE